MKEIKGSTVRRRYARLPLTLALGAMVLTSGAIGVGTSTAEAAVSTKGETGITLSGDARLRGFWREDADFNSDEDNTNRQLQHRARLYLDAQAAGGTSLHARIHMSGDGDDRGMYTWGGSAADRNSNVNTDYFYVRVPVGLGTVIAGRQLFNYGHKFRAWDVRGDRLTYSQKISDELGVFGYYQKLNEAQSTIPSDDALAAMVEDVEDFTEDDADALSERRAKDEDFNLYAIGMNYNAGPLTSNVQIRHRDQEWSGGDDGQEFIGFATYQMADLTLEFEGHFTTGDVFENAEGDNQHKIYLGGAYQMVDTTFTGGVAYAMAGSTANGHFDKISMFHNTLGGHGLGHTNFGAAPDGGDVDDALAFGLGVSHQVSPEMTLGGRLAYTTVDMYDVGNDADVVSFDASMAYRINASTTYHIDGIYANPDDVTPEDDAYYGLSHRLEIRF